MVAIRVMKVFLVLSFLVLLFLGDCSKEQDSASPTEINLTLGETKILGLIVGEVALSKVTFSSVNEGRCKREDCSMCYGGYVYATFFLQFKGSNGLDSVKLHRISCINSGDLASNDPNMDIKTIKGIKIGLVNITELTKNTNLNAYTAKLEIMQ